MSKVSRLEVISTGARRRWSLEEKQRIVAESFAVARNVSATARRYGLSNGQLFAWRRLAREGKLVLDGDACGFVPAVVVPEQRTQERLENFAREAGAPSRAEASPVDRIEIVLSDPRRIIVGGDVDTAALARVIGVLEQG